MKTNSQYPTRIALGWITVLVLLLVLLTTMIVFSAFDNDGFTMLRKDPGRVGLRQMTFLVALYAIMPILVYAFDRVRFAGLRWMMVAFAGANFFYLLLHHLSHWQGGERPTLGSHMIDIAINIVGVWLIYNSVRWAREAAVSQGGRE